MDVRRRPGTLSALDALIEWVSPNIGEPWADTWEPVTKEGIPDGGLRDEARTMWEGRQTARGVGKRKEAAAPPPAQLSLHAPQHPAGIASGGTAQRRAGGPHAHAQWYYDYYTSCHQLLAARFLFSSSLLGAWAHRARHEGSP